MAKGKKINGAAVLDAALNEQRGQLFQAMGVIGLAARAIQHGGDPVDGSLSQREAADIWTALDGAYDILNNVAAKLEDSETLTAKEVAHG